MKMKKLFDDLFSGKKVVVITGAGISTASGIPDFRSDNGIYNQSNEELHKKYPYLKQEMKEYYEYITGKKDGTYDEKATNIYLMSRTFLKRHPDAFYDYYTNNKILADDIKPNICHEVLVELEEAGYISCIITQNIDGLHQEAGSKNIIPIHGTNKFYCECCHKEYSKQHYMTKGYVCTSENKEGVKCNGIIRPGIVLYEEGYNNNDYHKCWSAVLDADVMIIVGTSATVSTIMRFIDSFIHGDDPDKRLYILNNQPTIYDSYSYGQRYGMDLSMIFEKIREELSEKKNENTSIRLKK
jgi:NAD-dependent deacetylase